MPVPVIILLVIIGFFIFMQVMFRMRGWRRRGKPVPEVKGALARAIRQADQVVVYFYSPACRACRTQEQFLPSVQQKVKQLVRINVRKDLDTAQKFGVMGTPTIVVIENRVIKDYFVGITPANRILRSLGKAGSSP
ncbi:MAG: thioredoxin family protein [Calditrichaeota bacterium]|nr:thioredoxin family protein [Calditrichota bacterium]